MSKAVHVPLSFFIDGPSFFVGQDFQFSIFLSKATANAVDILACEWYIDRVLIVGINSLDIQGRLDCGQHWIGARLLTKVGWTGLRELYFETCREVVATNIVGLDEIVEGNSAIYSVMQQIEGGSFVEVTVEYDFYSTEGGWFEKNVLYTMVDGSLEDRYVQITARNRRTGEELTKLIVVRNSELPPIEMDDADFMLVRFSWEQGAGKDLDILVGVEHSGTLYDQVYVGYGNRYRTVPPDHSPPTEAYLWWANDHVGTVGIETVLINLQTLTHDYPGISPHTDFENDDFSYKDFWVDDLTNMMQVGLYAVWRRGEVKSGRFTIELIGYKGGSMQQVGTDIVNIGGVEVSRTRQELETQKAGATQLQDYYRLGALVYNRTTKMFVLHLMDR